MNHFLKSLIHGILFASEIGSDVQITVGKLFHNGYLSLDTVNHCLEGCCQLADFVITLHRNVDVHIALGQQVCGLCEFNDGLS